MQHYNRQHLQLQWVLKLPQNAQYIFLLCYSIYA